MWNWDEINPWKPGHKHHHEHQCDDFFEEDHCKDNCKDHCKDCHQCGHDSELLMKIIKVLCILKKEVGKCEQLLCNPKFGLKEIKCEIKNIENAIFSPTFGLEEIKFEVSEILDIVRDINIEIPITLLNDIKSEVSAIESAVFSPTFGLEEIKSEVSNIETIVAGIEDMLDNPTFGLVEIKSEISLILANQGFANLFTTGPFLVECAEQTILLKALNNTASPQTVTFNIRTVGPNCSVARASATLSINTPCCILEETVTIPGTGRRNIEIRAILSDPRMQVYAATQDCAFNKVNEFKSAEWVPVATFPCL
ncbi:hypothetical protein [Desulforamulus aeronauticus]|uniref:Uncharacterized protein n=1 Tax=Desulforamulus aeronauticus DSM 10349 TaxID=1121421 RepID=A0A1M6VLL8_9FIRM|nr:hypothetical protein [Desulforamulus aeronauticus]SHK82235.1 hypothetical protein SAMN02745123_03243 [Desulforamulus aeronauticus DSM 10349]